MTSVIVVVIPASMAAAIMMTTFSIMRTFIGNAGCNENTLKVADRPVETKNI